MHMTIDRQTDDPPPATQTPAWCGWYRPHRRDPWRQLVTASTHDEAWGALLDALAQQGRRGGDSTVLSAGVDPNKGASPRQPAARQLTGH